ncbi:OsmC family protein [Microlunatus spumicola]|uniref:OsmC family protein n=1 Tax=Microlunatus spumicola TaxID=81499 RepID=A0ABP6XKF6_9ACTN
MPEHHYETRLSWADPAGTADYRTYAREHEVVAPGRPVLVGSADRPFRGDPTRWNPELLLLAALSECHLLSYLSFCARAGVVVTAYADRATGTMRQEGMGGRFTEVVLHPEVTVAEASMLAEAGTLHGPAHEACFIASSVSFPVRHEATAVAA